MVNIIIIINSIRTLGDEAKCLFILPISFMFKQDKSIYFISKSEIKVYQNCSWLEWIKYLNRNKCNFSTLHTFDTFYEWIAIVKYEIQSRDKYVVL